MSETTPTPDAAKSHEAAMVTFIDPAQLQKDIAIDLADITGAMQRHTGHLVFYGTAAVRARNQYDRYKATMEILEATLDARHRSVLKEENPKTTETQIRAAVLTDPAYRAGQARLITAQQQYKMADVAVSAFDARKDLLLQIARDAAREGTGPLRVMANNDGRERALGLLAKSAEDTKAA